MLSSPPDQRLEVLLPLGEGLHREDLPPDAFDLLLRPAASGCERSDHVQMFRRDLVHHVPPSSPETSAARLGRRSPGSLQGRDERGLEDLSPYFLDITLHPFFEKNRPSCIFCPFFSAAPIPTQTMPTRTARRSRQGRRASSASMSTLTPCRVCASAHPGRRCRGLRHGTPARCH